MGKFFNASMIGLLMIGILSCAVKEVDTGNARGFQESLTYPGSGQSSIATRTGTIPNAPDTSNASIRFNDLRTGNNLESIYSIIPVSANYGDAPTSFNVYAGNYVAIECIVDATSEPATKVFFQIKNAGIYVEFGYSPAISGSFNVRFKVPQGATNGTVTALISTEGTTPGVFTNIIRIILHVNTEGSSPQATNTIPSYTTTTTVVSQTITTSGSTSSSTLSTSTTTFSTTSSTMTTSSTTSSTTTGTTQTTTSTSLTTTSTGTTQTITTTTLTTTSTVTTGTTQTTNTTTLTTTTQTTTTLTTTSTAATLTTVTTLTTQTTTTTTLSTTTLTTTTQTTTTLTTITTVTTVTTQTTTTTTLTTTTLTTTTITSTTTVSTVTTATTTTNNYLADGRIMLSDIGSEEAHSIEQTSDGGYIISGRTNGSGGLFAGQGSTDLFIAKLTSTGALDTGFNGNGVRVFGSSSIDAASSNVKQTADNGYFVVTSAGGNNGDLTGQGHHGASDIIAIKLTSTGAFDTGFAGDGILAVGGSGSEYGKSGFLTSDGGYIIVGDGGSPDGDFASENDGIFAIKLTSAGTFDTSFGGGNGIAVLGCSGIELGNSIAQTTDNGYVIAGRADAADMDFVTETASGGPDIAIFKLTSTGVLDTSFNVDGIHLLGSSGNDWGQSLAPTADGGVVITGEIAAGDFDFAGQGYQGSVDTFVIKLTAAGALDTGFDGDGILVIGGTGQDNPRSVIQTSDNGFALTGRSLSSNGTFNAQGNLGGDAFVLKLNGTGLFDTALNGDGILFLNSTAGAFGQSIFQTSDLGYAAAGYTQATDGFMLGQGNPGANGAFVVKLQSNGSF